MKPHGQDGDDLISPTYDPHGRTPGIGARDGVSNVLTVPISHQRASLVLALGVLVLLVVHLFGLVSRFYLNRSNLYGTIDLFHLDGEANLPAWYATLLLLACGVVVGSIAVGKRAQRDPFARHWIGLALIILYICADEGAQFHELWTRPMRELTDNAGGWSRYAWIVPGALLALAVGAAYLRFLAHLPRSTARRFVVAGATFLSAAIGLDGVASWYISEREADFGYYLLAAAEELIEKIAVILAIDTALAYLSAQSPVIRLTFRNGSA